MENRRGSNGERHRWLIWVALATAMLLMSAPFAAVAASLPAGDSPAQRVSTIPVEEWPVVAQVEDEPSHFEYLDRLDPAVLEAQRAVRDAFHVRRLESTRSTLSKFGYRLEETPGRPDWADTMDLYRGDKLLISLDLDMAVSPELSAAGDDVAIFAQDARGKGYLVRPDSVVAWDQWTHGMVPPVFVGKQLAWLDSNQIGSSQANVAEDRYSVKVEGKEVYSFATEPMTVSPRVKRFLSQGSDWMIEVDGRLLVNGHDLNAERGYDEAFELRKLNGEPFYFYSKDGRVHVSYAGDTLPYEYDEVIHYRCCEPSMFNPGGTDRIAWFHALRDGVWHYVEIGGHE